MAITVWCQVLVVVLVLVGGSISGVSGHGRNVSSVVSGPGDNVSVSSVVN